MKPKRMIHKTPKTNILKKSLLIRFSLFTIGWFILLGEFDTDEIWLVFVILTTTTAISIYTMPPGHWLIRPLGLMKFFVFFLFTTLRGGWDVAKRAFSKTVPTDPDFISIKHNSDTLKTLILAWVISMLPGTASCVIGEETIVIHVLDKNLPVDEEIQRLQILIDGMFREQKKSTDML